MLGQNHHQSVRNRAESTAGGAVFGDEVALLVLENEGGRAAAVEVYGIDAAKACHYVCQVGERRSVRDGGLSAVNDDEHDCAVRGDACCGARVAGI